MRLLVHAGFHKTGTTSIQRTLDANRTTLAPVLRILLKPDMIAVTEAARACSRAQDEIEWTRFLDEVRLLFQSLDATDPRPVLMSCEDLAGHMPFRYALPDYGAAPRLAGGLAEMAEAVFPGARIDFVFTTRSAEAWVRSCWAQHVRATRFTEDIDSYAVRAMPHADLDAMAGRVAAAIAPRPLHRLRLEDAGGLRLGPLDPLLDIAGVPQDQRSRLEPMPPAKRSPPERVLQAMLDLNRSDIPWITLREEKRKLLRKASWAAN